MTIPSAHDALFRAAMANVNVAREFFLSCLPKKLLKKLNLNVLKLCPQTYIDKHLKRSQSDVVYRTVLKGSGKAVYLYLLCEHQSTPDPLMPFRLLKYNVGIWQDHLNQTGEKTLPLIANIVFYNGQKPYTYSTDFRDLFNAPKDLIDAVWAKPFTLVNVKDISDEEVRNNKWSGILTFFMKHAVARDFLLLLKPVIDVLREIEEAGGDDYVLLLLNYALSTTEASDLESFVEMVKSGVSQPAGEKIMTLAEQLMARGEQRGIEKGLYQGIHQGISQGINQGVRQGISQGIRQGEHNLFMRQLKKKFSTIPEKYFNRIDAADEEDLLLWGERLIVASTLQDIFEDE